MDKRLRDKKFEDLAISRRLILPRLIRLRDVPHYLGMDPNRFNAEVRPYLIEIPIGKQGIAFDRIDLDAWVDEYKNRCGRPPKAAWSKTEAQSTKAREELTKREFDEAVKKAMSRKQSRT
jgi:predicted DNA-binding transcriptional regulator AlpA